MRIQDRATAAGARCGCRTLPAGSVHLVEGEARLTLARGTASVTGKTLVPGEEVFIPAGVHVAVEVTKDSCVQLLPADARIRRSARRTIPASWDAFAARILAGAVNVALVLGAPDTGKTFLTTYLVNRLVAAGRNAAVLDCDTGQSVIGPPATIGFAVIREPSVFLSDVPAEALSFTGSYSPATSFIEYAAGLARLAGRARAAGCPVIVNTPGWVQGDGGRALTRAEVELVSPDAVALLERGDELLYARKRWASMAHRLAVPAAAAPRPAGVRAALRERGARRYFAGARLVELPFSKVKTDRSYLLSGRKLSVRRAPPAVLWAEKLGGRDGLLAVSSRRLLPAEIRKMERVFGAVRIKNIVAGDEAHREVALNDGDNNVLSLGIIERIDYRDEKFSLWAPPAGGTLERVRIVQFGFERLLPDGTELGPARPGSV